MFSVTYREADARDVAAIVRFQMEMARETEDLELDRATVTGGVCRVFESGTHGRYFVAERGGTVIACTLITYEWSDWRCGTVWWIQSVYVVPEERRQGVYAGLYSHIKAIAEATPRVKGIRLYVDRRNTRAQTVYTRLGMNGDHYQVFEWMKTSEQKD
ncbi:MAG TPA: GNAT family N-acetyltransferase [Terriglobia bacterium]|jgi:GNAT superfamily N-acetyltransferase